ncbi:MAG: hypothetical protein RLZ28_70 [Actinomycetota bacterium]
MLEIALIAGATIAILVFAWASLVERNWFVIRRESLAILPVGSNPIKVLHIGDVHLAPWQKRKIAWMLGLESLKPDLVVNTGDNLGHKRAVTPLLGAMQGLLKSPGVFVNGSNDYFAPQLRNPFSYLRAPSKRGTNVRLDTAALVAGFESAGWLSLNNRGASLNIKGLKVGFIGIDDAHDGLDDLGSLAKSRESAANYDFLIGVSHAPYLKVIDAMGSQKVDLLLAGHTHGGQVCVPFYGALTTNCDLPTKFAKGVSAWSIGGHAFLLNVVAGLGHSIYAPFRLACRPEVRLLELVAKQN